MPPWRLPRPFQRSGSLNLAIDVSPKCDCAGFSDVPIVPHLGVFASTDPVAIDQACVDKARHAPGIPGSLSEEMGVDAPGDRKFDLAGAAIEGLSEQTTINTGVVIGLGSRKYTMVDVSPAGNDKFRFPLDPRPTRLRLPAAVREVPAVPGGPPWRPWV